MPRETESPRTSACVSFPRLVKLLLGAAGVAAGSSAAVLPANRPRSLSNSQPAEPRTTEFTGLHEAMRAAVPASAMRSDGSATPVATTAVPDAQDIEQERAVFKDLFEAGVHWVFVLERHDLAGQRDAVRAAMEGANDAGVQVHFYRELANAQLSCAHMDQQARKPGVVPKIVNIAFNVTTPGEPEALTRARLGRVAELIKRSGGVRALCFADRKYSLGRSLKDPKPSVLSMGYSHGMGTLASKDHVLTRDCSVDLSRHPETQPLARLDAATQQDAFDGVRRAAPSGNVAVVIPRSLWDTGIECDSTPSGDPWTVYDREEVGRELGELGFGSRDVGGVSVFLSPDMLGAVPGFRQPALKEDL